MRDRRLDGVIGLLAVLAVGVVVHLVLLHVQVGLPRPSVLALALAVLVLVGESRTFVVGGPGGGEVSVSTTFALALAMAGPLWLLLPVQVLASLVDDVRRGKEARKLVFNTAQLVLTAVACRGAYCLAAGRDYLADDAPLTLRDVGAGLVGGAAFFVVNSGCTSVVVALALDVPLLQQLRTEARGHLLTQGVLLSSGPAVVAAAALSPLLLLLLILPILAVHRSATLAEEQGRRALHDDLTGLPNRPGLHAATEAALATGRSAGTSTAILLLDLDQFKDVNDTLGHDVGDRLLQEVARRLSVALRDGDTVARLGGDEFAVLAVGLDGAAAAARMAERLLLVLAEAVLLDGARLHPQASAGVAVAPGHTDDARVLLQRADVALYAAKQERGRVTVYDTRLDGHSHDRLVLAGELRDALDGVPGAGGLCAYFQPQCDAVTGAVIGVEALVRWVHPVRGLVPPDAFVPVAESTGLIGALTAQVLEQALAQARLLADAGHPVGVSVNLSARVLTDLDLPAQVATALQRAGVPADRLVLEVTESVVMDDPARTGRVLDGLRALGLELSVDDFGTGYSSLVHLTRLRADELKIDKSFVMAMATSREDAVIVRSTVDLGRGLGLRVVAEGVEDAQTWELLRALGCDVVQGYQLSRPLPPDDVLPWVRQYELSRLVPAQGAPGPVALSPGGLPLRAT